MSAIAQLRPNTPGSPDPAILLAALQACPESLAIMASGRMVYANPAWCGLFEYPQRPHGQGWESGDLLPGTLISAVAGARPGEERETSPDAGLVHTRRDGAQIHLEVASSGFELRGCEFQVVHARDVSRQWQAERRHRESQGMEAVGRLVGGVAHDFNNLLTGIMLYCDLLLGELQEDSRSRRHVQEMRMAGEHGAAMVQQLLAVARPSADESQLVVLNDVVREFQELLVRLIGENVIFSAALADDLGQVKMDPAQVQQILLNLVLNARDAMPEGGRITVSTRNGTGPGLTGSESELLSGQWVELSVADSGAGMDAATVERAFEPFFTTKSPGRGNGLGLATARRLVHQQGGTILAESEPGRGTRVSMRLPRIQPENFESSRKVIS
jgi:two-component system, cell cycle sensor histidine kinase and response regulator CckA